MNLQVALFNTKMISKHDHRHHTSIHVMCALHLMRDRPELFIFQWCQWSQMVLHYSCSSFDFCSPFKSFGQSEYYIFMLHIYYNFTDDSVKFWLKK